MPEKICYKCKKSVDISEFKPKKKNKDGLDSYCKSCLKIVDFEYRRRNKEKLRKRSEDYRKTERYKEYVKKRNKNKEFLEERRKKARKYYYDNKENRLKYSKKYYTEYANERKKHDIQFKITCLLRDRLSKAILNKSKTGSAIRDLGCSISEFKKHIESKFKPGMTWENHGEWHIDHIIPLASFDLTDRKQVKKACNYKNLQPLWAEENLKKGASVPNEE